jgi:hypothetical protein
VEPQVAIDPTQFVVLRDECGHYLSLILRLDAAVADSSHIDLGTADFAPAAPGASRGSSTLMKSSTPVFQPRLNSIRPGLRA